MASNGAIPPPIPEVSADLKFDGGVRISWTPVKRRIINSLKTQGLIGYTDGTIPKPTVPAPVPPVTVTAADGSTSTVTTPASAPAATAVFLTNPSLEEWIFRNDRAKGIIESHVDDLPSLITDSDSKNARELFDTFQSVYGEKDGMQKVLTMRKLRSSSSRATERVD
ncbi:hypothetical protein BT96DRAFT_951642 [Gymnopus androsaceus JB14]|uniref:Uncharacterized protein n=1 Tax=Gymnopus androsaceus JB14 TaxID=1447944 RepID=A0A6A4GC48_9AGAR|nr:hypothetical protein BT96DRAFT_951642 [Gymnopus androsaceus JB14]